MLRRLIGIAVTIAILVGLGNWMRDTFFPSTGAEGWQELQDRFDYYSGVATGSPSSATSETPNTPPTAAPTVSFRAVTSSQSPVTPTAVSTPNTSPLAVNAVCVQPPMAAVSATPITTPTPTATITPTPIPTAAATTEATPPTSESLTYEGMDSAYINGILSGLNDRRAAHGNAPLPLNASLSARAQDHAMRMAEHGDKFHSGMGLPEDASYAHISASAASVGAKATEHVIAFRDAEKSVSDASATVITKVTSVGIGAVRVGDRVYTCILGEETVEFILADAAVN